MRRLALALVVLLAAGCGGTKAAQHPTTAARQTQTPPPSKAYLAAVRYAQCMRGRGLPFPMPNAAGDFHLSYRRERALKAAATQKERNAADAACFHFLKGTVSTNPLSASARRQALQPLRALKACLASHGYTVGTPIVRNLSRGRAMFGFTQTQSHIPPTVQHTCENEVKLPQKLDAIIKADRRPAP
jgi:hypothetical protein